MSGYPAAGLVLACCFALTFTCGLNKSPAFDEVAHVTGGYSYWVENDYRLHPENGVLSQRWAALPLLAGNWRFPSLDQDSWRSSRMWVLADEFLYRVGNDPDAMLRLSRLMVCVLTAGLGLLVYAWSRRHFGPAGGMVSLIAYAFNPTVLANGGLATSDMAAALFFALSAWCLWKVLHRVTPWTVLASGLACSALLLSKMSGVLIAPVAIVLAVMRLAVRRPLPVVLGRRWEVRRPARQAAVLAAVMAVHVAVGAAAIWTAFGLRYSAFNPALTEGARFAEPWDRVLGDGVAGSAIRFARDHRLLPEAYLYGFAFVDKHSQERRAFWNGDYSLRGWPGFFPYTFAVKTPLSVFAVLILAILAGGKIWRYARRAREVSALRTAGRALYETAALWVPLAIYWAGAVASHLNIGHRHILPTYAPMLILAGAAGLWLRRGVRWMRIALAVSLGALVVECLLVWPNYLAYFNQTIGGRRSAYRHLVDSSLDWGQDLPALRTWLDSHGLSSRGGTPAYLSYFGTGSPDHYGIQANRLPGFLDFGRPPELASLRGGVYCISATMLQAVYLNAWGPWSPAYEAAYQETLAEADRVGLSAGRGEITTPEARAYRQQVLGKYDGLRLGRLCAFLRTREPDDTVNYSILIYRLTDDDVRKALYGPPAELREGPATLRRN